MKALSLFAMPFLIAIKCVKYRNHTLTLTLYKQPRVFPLWIASYGFFLTHPQMVLNLYVHLCVCWFARIKKGMEGSQSTIELFTTYVKMLKEYQIYVDKVFSYRSPT